MNRLDIHNRFDVEVIDSVTGKLKQKAVAYNVICNRFWDTFVNNISQSYHLNNNGIQYGSGSGTPSESDTSLFHKEGYAEYQSNITLSENPTGGVISNKAVVTLQPSQAVGVNISEVGMATDANNIITHAMLQDMNGNPISIQKTDTDLINIYATMYLHWDPQSGLHLQNDYYYSTYAYGIICKLFGMYNGYWSGVSGITWVFVKNVLEVYSDVNPKVNIAASTGSERKKLKYSKARVEATNGNNFGGYSFAIGSCNQNKSMVIELEKFCQPSEITGEAVGTGDGTKTRFGTEFDFPYDVTVYVNGMARSSGVTVNKYPGKHFNKMSEYIDCLVGGSTLENQVPYMYGANLNWNPFYYNGATFGIRRNMGTFIFRCRFPELGFAKCTLNGGSISGSNDLEAWTPLANGNLPEEHQHFKFYKISSGSNSDTTLTANSYDSCNIEFSTPPANGDVITISYKTKVVAKDADHVFDFQANFDFANRTV